MPESSPFPSAVRCKLLRGRIGKTATGKRAHPETALLNVFSPPNSIFPLQLLFLFSFRLKSYEKNWTALSS
jgi:hypothetical protein